MTARVLPFEEWGRLGESELSVLLPLLRPQDVEVVVVEDAGRIVATWAVLRVTHLEGLWIAPEYRGNVGVVRRLMRATITAARRWAAGWVLTGANNGHVRDLLARTGATKLDMDAWVMPIGEDECRNSGTLLATASAS